MGYALINGISSYIDEGGEFRKVVFFAIPLSITTCVIVLVFYYQWPIILS